MRPYSARRLFALAIALLPANGAALEWIANLGLLYNRADTWQAGQGRVPQPRLDVDLRLDLRDAIGGRGVFDYGGWVGYRRTSGSAVSDSSALTFRADAELLAHDTSPVTVTGFAERVDGRFEAAVGQDVVGDRLSSRYGGTIRLGGRSIPGVTLGYSRFTFDEEIDSSPVRSLARDQVTARVFHSVGAFGFGASYQGAWSDGTFVADRHTSHDVHVTGRANLRPYTDLTFSDRYFDREASSTAAGAFDLEANAFSAALRAGRTPGETTVVRYTSRHSVSRTASSLEEVSGNALNGRSDFRLGESSRFFLRGLADVTTTEQRTAAASARTSGGTLGAEAWWRAETKGTEKVEKAVRAGSVFELSGGPLAGFLAEEGASTRMGYGATARGSATIRQVGRQLGASYSVTYGRDLFGFRGWSLEQAGMASVGGPAGLGTYGLQATIVARRASGPLLGDELTRSVSVLGRYSWMRYTASAQASLSNGVVPGTEGFVGDGVFLPLGFDTRSLAIVVGAGFELFSNLVLRGDGRYSQTTFPGQPDLRILEANASVDYRFGAFSLVVEDRLTRSEYGAGPVTRNVIFVRVARTLGSRY